MIINVPALDFQVGFSKVEEYFTNTDDNAANNGDEEENMKTWPAHRVP